MFDDIFWKENKGMFVKINGKDYFVFVGFDDNDSFTLSINKQGDFIVFNKDNNKDDFVILLEKLANYQINRYIFNIIVDTLDNMNIKHNMIKR